MLLEEQGLFDLIPAEALPEYGERLFEILADLGWASPGAEGVIPLSYVELRAYSLMVGAVLSPWEARTVIRLSEEYCAGVRDDGRGIDIGVRIALASAVFMESVSNGH